MIFFKKHVSLHYLLKFYSYAQTHECCAKMDNLLFRFIL
jgi:hypothetical protein